MMMRRDETRRDEMSDGPSMEWHGMAKGQMRMALASYRGIMIDWIMEFFSFLFRVISISHIHTS